MPWTSDDLKVGVPAEGLFIEEQPVKVAKEADAALSFTLGETVTYDEVENKRIRRTIDRHIIPWMFLTFMVQYFDKTLLSYSSVMGIIEDTKLTSSEYAWCGSIFYFGYLAFVYPHNRLMQRFPLARYLSVIIVVWGVVLCLHADCTNFASLMVVRFILGALEGAVTAGFVLVTARWYQRDEQATRTAFWYIGNAAAQIGGAALAYGVAAGFLGNPSITFPGWKALFILSGGLTCIFGGFMFCSFAESPLTAKWLNDHDRHIAIERLRVNQQGIGSKVFKWPQFREAFTDPRTWLCCIFCVLWLIPSGGLTVFFALLIQGWGFDSKTTLLISMPSGVTQIVTNLFFSYLAGKLRNRMLTASLAIMLSILSIAIMTGLSSHGPTAHRIGQLVAYYIILGNSPSPLILILSIVSTNVAGYTKKTTVNALILIAYCVGFLIGPQTFRDPPYYMKAKYTILGVYSASLLCILGLWWINWRANQRRDLDAAELPPQPNGQEFLDLTDKENKYFRYAI
ncbi:uncharacterized protein A1O5_00144 [Cladophialophora psammophila CBS 110553]|uniref:Major facilitator superfamily (MFS) profile domain-containing protein n=1 Tax=Cladophialophora psammophila CBS 110553 TaxID=1182543 RepID=W9X557_9EURO|nr:uncharacterized protein A1O5_00144 [Cladophialophora psammophila CBS 110553]EXJ75637.1 hypothetical protein A1O5_00144 [Cladophialophora psammophila CBS 110553]